MNYLFETKHFNLEMTLTGGQAFRFIKLNNDRYFGVAGHRLVVLYRERNGVRLSFAVNEDLPFWLNYFDAETDYDSIVACFKQDETLAKACEFAAGLRLLRQEPFETLISFIISANNNIKRIRGIIERLCAEFGEKIGNTHFAFPTAETLSMLTPEDLAPIRAGFRAKYIIDASRRVHSGEVDLNSLYDLSYSEAKAALMRIKGVGEKVADCVLLCAYAKPEAFPKDVWVRRAMERFYPSGLPECVHGYENLANQYLFEYIRNLKEN